MANIRKLIDGIDELPNILSPLYSANINEPLFIARDNVIFEQDNEFAEGVGVVELRWYPTPYVRIKATFRGHELLLRNLISLQDRPLKVKFLGCGAVTEAFVRHVGSDLTGQPIVVDAILFGHGAGFGSDQVASLQFHLSNFVSYLGSATRYDAPDAIGMASSRLMLDFDCWRVELDSIPDISSRIKALKSEGGFSITHVGKIVRRDNSLYNPTDTYVLLEGLAKFFSFVRGRKTDPMLLAGKDAEGEIIWNEWRVNYSEPWKDGVTPF